ncbi:hypothetical protein B0H67DRAFT_559186 [Lasiosphaeris hirsuta]|uniref:Short-chain dehydrogenase n=1 Tax=Lasiosphaeris hirsuta TaxID=260670 RepID=A0AA40B8G5_9PEZI|nr:hypothetical protein B0H67DRAFT_559186 [Lasiosphaeris hirsuta]
MASYPNFNQTTTAEEVASAFASQITSKTILITGINPSGLGAAFASAVAPYSPSTLILTARTPAKALPVLASLRAANPLSPTTYHVIPLDLSSLASVRSAAAQIAALAPSIDILLNNAGVMALPSRTLSVDGVEMHLASNFLGHFLLTTLLSAQLRAAGRARVVNVTSAGFVLTPFRFSDFNFEEGRETELPESERVHVPVAEMMGFKGLAPSCGYVPMVAYAQANTANMLFSRRIGEVEGGVVGVSAAPGVVVTDLQRHLPRDFRNPYMFYKTPSQGVASFVVAALDPALEDHPGAYINHCQVEKTADYVESPEMAARLWDLADGLCRGS